VVAPGRYPNGSLSINDSGIAAQFSATNGLSARSLAACMARANASFPAPVGPRIITGTRDDAMRRALRTLRSICGSVPASSSSPRTVLVLRHELAATCNTGGADECAVFTGSTEVLVYLPTLVRNRMPRYASRLLISRL